MSRLGWSLPSHVLQAEPTALLCCGLSTWITKKNCKSCSNGSDTISWHNQLGLQPCSHLWITDLAKPGFTVSHPKAVILSLITGGVHFSPLTLIFLSYCQTCWEMSVSAVWFAVICVILDKHSQSSGKHFGKAVSTPCRADSLRRQRKNPAGRNWGMNKSLSPSYGWILNSWAWEGKEGAGIAALSGCGETPAAH